MGLDMYLEGRKSLHHKRQEDGYTVSAVTLDLGYWRKHPNLHGYIVENFAESGEDDCKPIELCVENLQQIIAAVGERKLPPTEGFFFGTSDLSDEAVADDLKMLTGALNWLNSGPDDEYRSVQYVASW